MQGVVHRQAAAGGYDGSVVVRRQRAALGLLQDVAYQVQSILFFFIIRLFVATSQRKTSKRSIEYGKLYQDIFAFVECMVPAAVFVSALDKRSALPSLSMAMTMTRDRAYL